MTQPAIRLCRHHAPKLADIADELWVDQIGCTEVLYVWQVWRTPGFQKSVAPMQLHRTYGQCHAEVTALDWSQDSQWLAAVSKDLSAR